MSVLDSDLSDDLFHLICGRLIGRGQYRTVYNCAIRTDWVIKMDNGGNFSNISEYQIYDEFKDTPIAKWLAPVRWISSRGLWLVQDKTEPMPTSQMPKKVPAIFADIKPDNWGILNGRPVCHDYGNNRVFEVAAKPGAKLRKAPKHFS